MNEVLDAIKALGQEISNMKAEMFDMRKEFNEKLDNTRKEFNEKLEDTKKDILDRQFLFENEYGDRIKSMYDILVMTKDKEYDNHKEIEILDNRLTCAEANIFKQGEDIKFLTQTR